MTWSTYCNAIKPYCICLILISIGLMIYYPFWKVSQMMYFHETNGHMNLIHLDNDKFEIRAIDMKNITLLPNTDSSFLLVLVPRIINTIANEYQIATKTHTFSVDIMSGHPTTNGEIQYAIPLKMKGSEEICTYCILWACENRPCGKSVPMVDRGFIEYEYPKKEL